MIDPEPLRTNQSDSTASAIPGAPRDAAATTATGMVERDAQTESGIDSSAPTKDPRTTSDSERRNVEPMYVYRRWQIGGVVAIGLGVAVAVVPLLWDPAAQALQPLGEVRNHSVSLVVGGLLSMSFGVLRRALWGMRRTLDSMSHETARMKQLAFENRRQSSALQSVQVGHKEVKDDVARLRQAVQHLTDLAAQPEQAKALLKLAGSVDQQRARFETSLKEETERLRQGLDEATERNERAVRKVTAMVGELESLATEQHQTLQLSSREALEQTSARQDALQNELARILEQIVALESRQRASQDTVEETLDATTRSSGLIVDQISERVASLGSQLSTLEEQLVRPLHVRMQTLSDEIGRIERDREASLNALADHIEHSISGQSEKIARDVEALTTVTKSSDSVVIEHIDRLGSRLDDHAALQQNTIEQFASRVDSQASQRHRALESALARATEAAHLANAELNACVERLGSRLDKHAVDQQTAVEQAVERASDAARVAHAELNSTIEQVASRVDSQASQRHRALESALARATEAAQLANAELNACVERLGSRLDKHAVDQQTAVEQAVERASDAARVANAELNSTIEQVASRFDSQASQRHRALESALARATEAAHLANAELNACVERLGSRLDEHAVDQQTAVEQAVDRASEAARVANAELNGTIEQFASRFDENASKRQRSIESALSRAMANAQLANAELNACIERLGSNIDEHAVEQRSALESTVARAIESARDAKAELSDCIERLGARIEEQSFEQQGTIEGALARTAQTLLEANVELSECIAQVGIRVDERALGQELVVTNAFAQTTEAVLSGGIELGAAVERLSASLTLESPSHPRKDSNAAGERLPDVSEIGAALPAPRGMPRATENA